ncbi:hypothetical protein [Sessilibacter corallicola]|uniref:hypothetical protein n=1 Tax=Sessilibacter corallicola TaxID=2904075 RepID=UPI0033429F6A
MPNHLWYFGAGNGEFLSKFTIDSYKSVSLLECNPLNCDVLKFKFNDNLNVQVENIVIGPENNKSTIYYFMNEHLDGLCEFPSIISSFPNAKVYQTKLSDVVAFNDYKGFDNYISRDGNVLVLDVGDVGDSIIENISFDVLDKVEWLVWVRPVARSRDDQFLKCLKILKENALIITQKFSQSLYDVYYFKFSQDRKNIDNLSKGVSILLSEKANRETIVYKLKAELQKKDAIIQKLSYELNESQESLDKMSSLLLNIEKDRDLVCELKVKLLEKNKSIQECFEKLKEKDNSLSKLSLKLEQSLALIEQYKIDLDKKSNLLLKLEEMYDLKESEKIKLQIDIEYLRRKLSYIN